MNRNRWNNTRRTKLRPVRDLFLTALFLSGLLVAVVLVEQLNVQRLKGAVKVVDGDSLRLGDQQLRLLGIDAPEFNQICKRDGVDWKCGSEAHRALSELVGAELECAVHGVDRYDRKLVICRSGDVEVNAAMVKAGWAVNYGGYGKEEQVAKNARHGLWAGSFDRPQEWRRARRLEALDRRDVELAGSLKLSLARWWRGVFD